MQTRELYIFDNSTFNHVVSDIVIPGVTTCLLRSCMSSPRYVCRRAHNYKLQLAHCEEQAVKQTTFGYSRACPHRVKPPLSRDAFFPNFHFDGNNYSYIVGEAKYSLRNSLSYIVDFHARTQLSHNTASVIPVITQLRFSRKSCHLQHNVEFAELREKQTWHSPIPHSLHAPAFRRIPLTGPA